MLLTLILLFTLVHVSHVFSLKNTYILYMTIFSKERIEIHYRQLKKVRTATRIKIDPCGKTFLFVISVDDVATLLVSLRAYSSTFFFFIIIVLILHYF